jgi:hypothetical protein
VRASLLTAWLALACAAGLAADLPPAVAQGAAVSERSVKAAFLCKFAAYVEWPGDPQPDSGALTIGVLGSAGMAGELARITADRTVNDRPVRIRTLAEGDSLAGLRVIFVGADEGMPLAESLSRIRGLPILVVTDAPGALASGSIINFTAERDRVRFEVSLPAAERSGLKLSSRLLAVAQRVERDGGT